MLVAEAVGALRIDPDGHGDRGAGLLGAAHGSQYRSERSVASPAAAAGALRAGKPPKLPSPTFWEASQFKSGSITGSGGAEGPRCCCGGVREAPGSALARQNCALLRVPPWLLRGQKGLRRRKRRSKLLIWRFQRGFLVKRTPPDSVRTRPSFAAAAAGRALRAGSPRRSTGREPGPAGVGGSQPSPGHAV